MPQTGRNGVSWDRASEASVLLRIFPNCEYICPGPPGTTPGLTAVFGLAKPPWFEGSLYLRRTSSHGVRTWTGIGANLWYASDFHYWHRKEEPQMLSWRNSQSAGTKPSLLQQVSGRCSARQGSPGSLGYHKGPTSGWRSSHSGSVSRTGNHIWNER
jgi:hypothetical protein